MSRIELPSEEILNDPKRKSEYTKKLFAVVARGYNKVNFALSFGRDESWKKRMIAELPAFNAPSCLDLATGTGDLALRVAARYPDAKIRAVDVSPEMLAQARVRDENRRVEWVEGDLADLDAPDGSVDLVTGGYALRNTPDLEALVAKLGRMTRSGGVASFLEFAKPDGRFHDAVQRNLMRFWFGFWGLVLHGNPAIYTYIPQSLKPYPDRSSLKALFERHGFRLVKRKTLMFGFMDRHVFTKV